MRDVVVYTTESCSFCTRVKMLLRSQDINFHEVNLAGDPDGVIALAGSFTRSRAKFVAWSQPIVERSRTVTSASRCGVFMRLELT